jgi:hypothetical protein
VSGEFAQALKAASEDMEAKHAVLRQHMAINKPSLAGLRYSRARDHFTDLARNATPELLAVLETAEASEEMNDCPGCETCNAFRAALDALDGKVGE